jgi:pantetheine-phosphate adenylyltransferase
MSVAVVTGMFDLFTYGHGWLVARAAELADVVQVVIGPNATKTPLFTMSERLTMIREVYAAAPRIIPTIMSGRNMADHVNQIKTNQVFVVRGIRNANDFPYEEGIVRWMRERTPAASYVFLIPPPEHQDTSSTLVKSLCERGLWGDVAERVNPSVLSKLQEKYGQPSGQTG